jgi:hypothetical protein
MIKRISVRQNRVLAHWMVSAAMLASPAVALAGAGHDHAEATTAVTAGSALPRFAAVSETFELVGVLEDRRLTLYLDHAVDNSPVKDAQLQLEVGGTKVEVTPHGEGEFHATLAQAPKPGVIPVTATVIAGAETDLLAGELDVHGAEIAQHAAHTHSWKEYAAWIAAALIALAALAWVVRRRMRSRAAGIGRLA